jgi:TP901 family phage tail tape measure protein
MDIKLNVGSDKPFKLNGLDAELARLKEFQGILTDLGVPKAAKIDIQVTGADNLLRARSHVEQIISLLKQAGEGDFGEKLKANLQGPEAVFASISAKADQMKAKLHEMRQTLHANMAEFAKAAETPGYTGKTQGLGRPISHEQAVRSAKEFRDALTKAEADTNTFSAKAAAAEAAALLAKSLIGLNAAAAASASPMQAATTQTEAHAKAAAHDAAETNKAAAAQEALNRAKEKSRKVTAEAMGVAADRSILLAKGGDFWGDAAKRGLIQGARDERKQGDWWDAAVKRAGIADFREAGKADDWWDKAVRRGTLDGARRERKAGEWWDDAVSRGNMDSARRSGKADDWWDSAVKKGNLDARRRADLADKEKLENDKMVADAMAEDGRLKQRRLAQDRDRRIRDEDRARRAQEPEAAQPGILGGYGQKLGAVAMYTAAASTVYAGLHAVKSGISGAVSTDRQQAVLQAVFRGTSDEAKKLTLDTLALAQANGRDTEEAMKAAVAWGRLGHSRSETGRLIEISMRAANVAEISTEESAKNLAAIYSSFRMDVGGVSSALDQMNSTSNRSNVAVKDLMSGVARAGAVARAAGMDFATLNSLVGVGVAGTGRPGAEFGNAIKSMLVTMADPAKQAVLKSQYGIDAFKADGTAKTGNEFVRELARRSQGMEQDQKMDMLRIVGGKQQASRLAVMLDKHGEAESMAIESMLDLNASQKESLLILDTTEAKLKGLSAAWTGMWHSAFQGSKGNINGLLTRVTNAMPAVGNFMGRAGAVLEDIFNQNEKWDAVDAFDRNSETGKMLAAFNREGEKKQAAIKDIAQRKAGAEMQAESLRAAVEHFGMTGDRAADLKGIKKMARDAAANDPSRRKDLEKHWTELYESDGPDAVRAEVIGEVALAQGRAKDAGEQTRAAMSDMAAFLENKQAYLETKRAEAQAAIDAPIEKERARRKETDDIVDDAIRRTPGGPGGAREAQIKRERLSRPPLDSFAQDADRRTLAQIEAQIKDYKERAEDNRGRMTYLTDPDDDTPDMARDRAQQRRRDMAPLRFGAIGQWMSGLPMGSDREVDKLARERGILDAQAAFMKSPESHGISAGKREAMMLQIAERGNELEAKGPGAQAHDTVMRGVRSGRNEIGGFGAGLNQTDRIMDSIRGIQGMVPDITAQKARGGDDALLASGRALTLNAALTHDIEALDTRRAALAKEIAQAKMEENKHAAEGLAFASRSDQLTAAIFQKRLQTKGQMTAAEMFMYSPETLRAAKERVPGVLPFGNVADLEREKARIGPAIEDAKARAAAIRPALEAAQAPPPIQFPAVNVNVDAAAQVGEFLNATRQLVLNSVGAQFAVLTSQVNAMAAIFGGVSVQSAGSDVIIGGS